MYEIVLYFWLLFIINKKKKPTGFQNLFAAYSSSLKLQLPSLCESGFHVNHRSKCLFLWLRGFMLSGCILANSFIVLELFARKTAAAISQPIHVLYSKESGIFLIFLCRPVLIIFNYHFVVNYTPNDFSFSVRRNNKILMHQKTFDKLNDFCFTYQRVECFQVMFKLKSSGSVHIQKGIKTAHRGERRKF